MYIFTSQFPNIVPNSCSIDCCGLSRKLPLCCFRGFLRSDTLIGTINVKLQPLETKCDIHDTYDVSILLIIIHKLS